MSFENDIPMIIAAIWHWIHGLNNKGKWESLKGEKNSVGRKWIFKKISLLFFGVNVNVFKRTSLQTI